MECLHNCLYPILNYVEYLHFYYDKHGYHHYIHNIRYFHYLLSFYISFHPKLNYLEYFHFYYDTHNYQYQMCIYQENYKVLRHKYYYILTDNNHHHPNFSIRTLVVKAKIIKTCHLKKMFFFINY